MILMLLIAGLGRSPYQVQAERVDLIELNHVCRFDGQQFHQLILWEWSKDHYRVVAWRACDKDEPLTQIGNSWSVRWRDRDFVEAEHRRETWTLKDPEVEDRKRWPERLRRQLFQQKDRP